METFVRGWTSPAFGGIELLLGHYGSFEHPRHCHAFDVLGTVEQGQSWCWIEGIRHAVKPGQVVYIPAGTVHTGEKTDPEVQIYRSFYLPPGLVKMAPGIHPQEDWAGHLRRVHAELWQEPNRDLAERCLSELLTAFETSLPVVAQRPLPEGVNRTLRAVREASSASLALADLADIAGLSPFHFVGVFRNAIGMTPHQYVLNHRVERARRLLLEGIAPGEAAAEAGFADQSHLTRVFRRFVGETPGAFAKSG